ncbi:hypothetical protein N9N67_09885, partial [Bacteriovoracaceae bacterium]|nr:hypothetical protein [Bacteriovoracaceae bacterium]
QRGDNEDLNNLFTLSENFSMQLSRLDSYYEEVEVKKIISKMIGYVDSLKTFITKLNLDNKNDKVSLLAIEELSDKILDSFSEFQDIQYYQNEQRDQQIKSVISEIKRNMLISLIITFFGTILLAMVVPGKIALPFKKINDAVREIQECNFDVSIYYNKKDEIGELSNELNKMIVNMKKFEELREDRINVEHRKFDLLANLMKKNVLVINTNRRLIYLNNMVYQLLGIDSDDVLDKDIDETVIPTCIKEMFDLALKRRSKIENGEVKITKRKIVKSDIENGEEDKEETFEEEIFNGFANVVPIRAKDSSLDYYVMIISKEVFT